MKIQTRPEQKKTNKQTIRMSHLSTNREVNKKKIISFFLTAKTTLTTATIYHSNNNIFKQNNKT